MPERLRRRHYIVNIQLADLRTQGAFFAQHVVEHLEQRNRILASGGDNAICPWQNDARPRGNAHAVGAFQRAQTAVFAAAGAFAIISANAIPPNSSGEAAQQSRVNARALGLELLSSLGQGFLLDQALVNQAGDPLEAFLELGLYGSEDNRAVFLNGQVGGVIVQEGVQQERINGAIPATGVARERDFVVGVAVAVGILLLEGAQYVNELVNSVGVFRPRLNSPLLVNPRTHGVVAVIALVNGGQGVDVAIQRSVRARQGASCWSKT